MPGLTADVARRWWQWQLGWAGAGQGRAGQSGAEGSIHLVVTPRLIAGNWSVGLHFDQ